MKRGLGFCEVHGQGYRKGPRFLLTSGACEPRFGCFADRRLATLLSHSPRGGLKLVVDGFTLAKVLQLEGDG